MVIGVVVLNTLNELQVKDSLSMLDIGLICISLSLLTKQNQEKLHQKRNN